MDGRIVTVALGGMDERQQPEKGSADLLVNLYRDPEGYWAVMPGLHQVINTGNNADVVSLFWFNPRPNIRWLIVERGTDETTTELVWCNLPNQSVTSILSGWARKGDADAGTQFVENGRWVYFVSPVNPLTRWNGYRTVPAGFATGAPMPRCSGADQGFNYIDRCGGNYNTTTFKNRRTQRGVGPYPDTENTSYRYAYGLTMRNDLQQESPMSALAYVSGENGMATSNGRHMNRIDVPLLPDHVVACTIWRSVNILDEGIPGLSVALFEGATFPMAGGFSFIDHTPDEELGAEFDPDSTGPIPQGSHAAA